MKNINSNWGLILVLLFLLFSLMIRWIGWNEESRFLLSLSIVEDHALEITKYANFTLDKAYYDGSYYSDKEPLVSFLVTPVLFVLKSVSQERILDGEKIPILIEKNNTAKIMVVIPNENTTTRLARILVVIVGAIIPGVSTIYLFWKSLADMKTSEKLILLSTVILVTSTTFITYSVVFFEISFATFFCFLSFYLIYKKKRGFLGGLSYSLAIGTSIFFISMLPSFLYLSRKKNTIRCFLIGFVLGSFPLLIYNFTLFGTPLTTSHLFSMKQAYLAEKSKTSKVLSNILSNSLVYIIDFFFLNPILVPLFLHVLLSSHYKVIKNFVLISFLSILLFLSALRGIWTPGSSYGPRYLGLITVFLFLFYPGLHKRLKKRKCLCYLTILLVAISFFHTFLGFSTYWKGSLIRNNEGRIDTSLYNYYLSKYLRYGFRSLVLEDLSMRRIPDIRFLGPEREEYYASFYILPPHFSDFLVSIILLLFLRDIKRGFEKFAFFLFIILIGYVVVYSANMKLKGAYPIDPKNFWVKQKASYVVQVDRTSLYLVSFCTRNYADYEKTLTIKSGNITYRIFSTDSDICHKLLFFLKKGKNEFEIYSKDTCKYPIKEEKIPDYRCLNFLVSNITIENLSENKFFYTDSGKFLSSRDVSRNWKLIIYNPYYPHVMKVKIGLDSPISQEMSLGSKSFYLYKGENLIDVEVFLENGINVFDFQFEKCISEKSRNDLRCISATIKKIIVYA